MNLQITNKLPCFFQAVSMLGGEKKKINNIIIICLFILLIVSGKHFIYLFIFLLLILQLSGSQTKGLAQSQCSGGVNNQEKNMEWNKVEWMCKETKDFTFAVVLTFVSLKSNLGPAVFNDSYKKWWDESMNFFWLPLGSIPKKVYEQL